MRIVYTVEVARKHRVFAAACVAAQQALHELDPGRGLGFRGSVQEYNEQCLALHTQAVDAGRIAQIIEDRLSGPDLGPQPGDPDFRIPAI